MSSAHMPSVHMSSVHMSSVYMPSAHISSAHMSSVHMSSAHMFKCSHVQCPHAQCPHAQCPHVQCPHIQCPHVQCPHVQFNWTKVYELSALIFNVIIPFFVRILKFDDEEETRRVYLNWTQGKVNKCKIQLKKTQHIRINVLDRVKSTIRLVFVKTLSHKSHPITC